MKCPFGYTGHPVTWRCYAIYGLDKLLAVGYRLRAPWWCVRGMLALMGRIEK